MSAHTMDDLRMMQALPLSVKVRMTETRIRQWVQYYGEDGVYVSFSGGKDSTVLLDIVRGLYPDIPAVFVNTGLEFPEIQQFVKTYENAEIIRPKMSFNEVVKNFGYPFITKEVSQTLYYARRNPKSEYYKKLFGDKKYKGGVFDHTKWQPLYNIEFIIGSRCCQVMKKNPALSYGAKSKRCAEMRRKREEQKRIGVEQKWRRELQREAGEKISGAGISVGEGEHRLE